MTERVRRRGSAISTAVEIKPPPSTAKKQHAGAVFLRLWSQIIPRRRSEFSRPHRV